MNIIGFLLSLALFVAGLYLMAFAFSATGAEALVFIAGILVTTIGVFIPIHIVKRIDG